MADTKHKKVYHWGTGRRKTAVARVRLNEGSGKIEVNRRELNDFFTEDRDRGLVVAPLELTDMRTLVDVFVNGEGGGFTGQAGAICQGMARALMDMFAPAAAPAAEGAEPTPAAG